MKRTIGDRLLHGYLSRRVDTLQEVVDTSRVFSRRYNAAVDELEELEELSEALATERRSTRDVVHAKG